ncbi:MAG: nucleotide exchange factor GrpE [Firmicutes bacterium]|nr:nucleotide exchange factor GrpE [Bacillota bacterium]
MEANQEKYTEEQEFPAQESQAAEEAEAAEPMRGAEDKEEREKLAEALRQRDEYLEMSQRIQAEFENFRKRNSAARAEAWEDGARETISLMLPVLDNMERALEAAKERNPLRDGVEMVYRQMLDLLEKRGVSVINRVGEPFDPELENAVMQVGAENGEPGTVFAVMQKGYKAGTRVVRHAMVSVVASG